MWLTHELAVETTLAAEEEQCCRSSYRHLSYLSLHEQQGATEFHEQAQRLGKTLA